MLDRLDLPDRWFYPTMTAGVTTDIGWCREGSHYERVINLPGIKKEDISLVYKPEIKVLELTVQGYETPRRLSLPDQADPDNIAAELNLGVLKIRSPIKDTSRQIQIK